jgi:hypothetical protein
LRYTLGLFFFILSAFCKPQTRCAVRVTRFSKIHFSTIKVIELKKSHILGAFLHVKTNKTGGKHLIYICDAVMGSGKTSAAINFINAHPDKKFIYVTPFITETTRIKDSCPHSWFYIPSNKKEITSHQKREDLKAALSSGKNIAMTHVLLSLCDEDAIALIKSQEYTMILDEAMSVMTKIEAKADDVATAMSSPWFKCDTSQINIPQEVECVDGAKKYNGNWMKEMMLYSKSHKLVALKDRDGEDKLFCMALNEDIITASKETYILTYMFEASSLSCLFKIHHSEYQTIGISVTPDGEYQFSKTGTYIPEYVKTLKDKIHIEYNKKLNAIGEEGYGGRRNALSAKWQTVARDHPENGHAETLRKNMNNFFRNFHGDIPANERLWSCHSCLRKKLSGKGYTKQFLTFNSRAVNDFKNARVLAYCINVFMPLWEQRFYEQRGVTVNSDAYALSTMIQWIWRSAIRDGKEIWIYVPSYRMRELLKNWIDEVSAGKTAHDTSPVVYTGNISINKGEPA